MKVIIIATLISTIVVAKGDAQHSNDDVENDSASAVPNRGLGRRSKPPPFATNNKQLDWLQGEWFLCDERQTRLLNNIDDRFLTLTTACSDIFGFNITSLTDDNMNFKLEHLKGFSVPCKAFGIEALTDVDCSINDGKIEINEVFVGASSINPRWQNEMTFVGKRFEYKDPNDEIYKPITTFIDGYYTTLKVDITNCSDLFVVNICRSRRRYRKQISAYLYYLTLMKMKSKVPATMKERYQIIYLILLTHEPFILPHSS